ncbi:MAG: hypothetical protein IVW56_02305 [Candidatus Binataceae bacterium]|nr:hypothetical protein [Candidatus Binataceae bacterium]
MLRGFIVIAVLAGFGLFAIPARALEIRKAGKIDVPAGADLVPFSTDPTIANVLRQDLEVHGRSASDHAQAPLTLTVSVNEQPLKPGVSMSDLAPGDPQVAALIRAAGATPPPLGDTGTAFDEVALARARAENNTMPPAASPMQQILSQIQNPNAGVPTALDPGGCMPGVGPCMDPAAAPTPRPQPGTAGYTGDTQQYLQQGHQDLPYQAQTPDDNNFDSVIVARVSLSGSPDEMTIVAVTHPGEDGRSAKKLIAEEIANSVLH